MGQPLFEVNDFAVAAGGVPVLRGFSASVDAGRLVGLTGPSGCGKTTLLRALAGLIDPEAGEVLLEGQAPADWGWPAYRRRAILVEQRPVFLEGTVRESLQRPFAYGVSREAFSEDRACSLLERLHVESVRLDQEARSLSEGQRQRVSLVRALLLEPAILLLDEPTASLDHAAAEAVEALVSEEADGRGLAALIVTHDRGQASRWCHETVDLSESAIPHAPLVLTQGEGCS